MMLLCRVTKEAGQHHNVKVRFIVITLQAYEDQIYIYFWKHAGSLAEVAERRRSFD